MPRLSIVVPLELDLPAFEATLASVLQNRPADCEVLVPHSGEYDDPYALDGEVRFLEQAPASSLVELLNGGLERARGELLHVLLPGQWVDEGWTEAPVGAFDDPRVGSVVPVVVFVGDPAHAASCGVGYSAGGSRWVAGVGQSVQTIATRPPETCGPSLTAGFYRTDPLCSLEGFSPEVGQELADIDLALGLLAAGYRTQICSTCVIHSDRRAAAPTASFQQGWYAERLFRRHAAHVGRVRAALSHPLTVLLGALGDIPHPGSVAQVAGRVSAWFEHRGLRHYRQLLEEARDEAECAAQATLRMPDFRPASQTRRAA